MKTARGIPEVPPMPDHQLRRFLSEIREAVVRMQKSVAPPRPVTNLKATAKAGGVIIQFTRSDGESFILYRSETPDLNKSTRFDLGNAPSYTDEIGIAGVKRYYWVRAVRGQMRSAIAGPVNVTTLALTAEITYPEAPPSTDEPVLSTETGEIYI